MCGIESPGYMKILFNINKAASLICSFILVYTLNEYNLNFLAVANAMLDTVDVRP